MTQQSPVQDADDGQRQDVGEREETAVEAQTDGARRILVDVDVDARRTLLAGVQIVLDVVLVQQRAVGGGHDQPHQADDDDRVALSAQRAGVDRVDNGQIPLERHQHLPTRRQPTCT